MVHLLALYVAVDDLPTLIHERLLLLLVAFADRRGLEIESKIPRESITEFMWALVGFLWHPDRNLLIRPSMREMVNSFELLRAVDQQIRHIMNRQKKLVCEVEANISEGLLQNMVVTTGMPVLNTVAP